VTHELTESDLAIGDAVHDAVRLQVAGDVAGAAAAAIPAAKWDPILTASILAEKCSHAVHQYAAALGISPLEAYDRLWTKPDREVSDAH
jgi:hypothetical protein